MADQLLLLVPPLGALVAAAWVGPRLPEGRLLLVIAWASLIAWSSSMAAFFFWFVEDRALWGDLAYAFCVAAMLGFGLLLRAGFGLGGEDGDGGSDGDDEPPDPGDGGIDWPDLERRFHDEWRRRRSQPKQPLSVP
jgi:hypothetical protein